MTIELRVLAEDEWDVWYRTLNWAFGGAIGSAEEVELWRSLTEVERSIAAWDGDRVVATASTFSFGLSVPGGDVVPAGGLTMVGVAPTYRRRGILRRMMRQQLDDVRAAGEPLAVLTASEPSIYGRFGYGTATWQLSAEIETRDVRLSPPPGIDDVEIRVAEPADVLAECEVLYARQLPLRPGRPARSPRWERFPLHVPAHLRAGASQQLCVLAERAGELLGYVRYITAPAWTESGPDGTVIVQDLEAVDPAGYAALLRYLMEIDLMSSVRLANRPVDDPLLHLLSDVRRCALRTRDGMHLRPVEAGAALAARRYATEVDVVLEITDSFCPWNEGRWRLSGGPDGAVCARTADAPDLALSANELGSAYLGGISLTALAGAGRVRELRPGALTAASTAFTSPAAPWLPHTF
ncbi:GNAT family N-acetyltransferase [Streptomyces sp. JH002]|uniref:GNAT family N-acetyltransferase n=1 Tax=Streptomyces sp. JH002 TaxID=2763259 RepID=UPI003D800B61